MTTTHEVYRHRGPRPIAVYGEELAVYQPGDIIPDAVVEAHSEDSLSWTPLARLIREKQIKREPLVLPATVEPDDAADIVAEVVAKSAARARSARRGRKAEQIAREGADHTGIAVAGKANANPAAFHEV